MTSTGIKGGVNPISGHALGSDGAFYETTSNGGSFFCGTVFSMSPAGFLSTLHSFNWYDGCNPLGTLLPANDGNFYGTTYAGGAAEYGTVFRMTPAGQVTRSITLQFSTEPLPTRDWSRSGMAGGTAPPTAGRRGITA